MIKSIGVKRFLIGGCVVGLLSAFGATADMVELDTGVYDVTVRLQTDNFVPFDTCDGGLTPGGTQLTTLSYFHPGLQDELWLSIQAALAQQYTSYVDEGNPGDPNDDRLVTWNYQMSAISLEGTLTVDWYQAVDVEIGSMCRHGAEIVAYYDPTTGEDGYNLDWIQLYTESGGSVHSPYGYTVDGSQAGDTDPAYYMPGDGPWIPPGYSQTSANGDMIWTDGPYDSHYEALAWAGGVDFYIFLASYSGLYNEGGAWFRDITVFDGVTWGYDGICVVVPEPGTVILLGLGITGLLARRRWSARRE